MKKLVLLALLPLLTACASLDAYFTQERIDRIIDDALDAVELVNADADGDGEPDFDPLKVNPTIVGFATAGCTTLAGYLTGTLVKDGEDPILAAERRVKILAAAEGACRVLGVALAPAAPTTAPAPSVTPDAEA